MRVSKKVKRSSRARMEWRDKLGSIYTPTAPLSTYQKASKDYGSKNRAMGLLASLSGLRKKREGKGNG